MIIKNFLKNILPDNLLMKYKNRKSPIARFEYDNKDSVRENIENKYNYSGELMDFFVENKDCLVHKWHHYLPIYDEFFSKYKDTKNIKFLEIGVSEGGSLQMWRKFFGKDAIIYGIDINPECERYDGQSAQVRIGSQVDKDFLESVISEMGGVDIVLDDGSHHMKHVSKTLRYLFPHLSFGGLYMIEDLHTSYWKSYGGGFYSRNNFFRYLNRIIDDMHHWYHYGKLKEPDISNSTTSIHIYDSLVAITKNKVFEPTHSRIV